MVANVPSGLRCSNESAMRRMPATSPSSACGECPGEIGPRRFAVHRTDGGRHHRDVVDGAAVDARPARASSRSYSASHRAPTAVCIGGIERARLVTRTPLRPVVERALETDELGDVLLLDRVAGGFVRRVEHHRPHPVGEQRGVDGAEVGAVRDAEVRDLLVAERLADLVHVAGGVLGGVVDEIVAVLLPARIGDSASAHSS